MKAPKLEAMSNDALVNRFGEICVAQDVALLYSQVSKFNSLFRQLSAISQELKRRPGDQRDALSALFDHENAQVRLQAARFAWARVPTEARAVVEAIAKSKKFPQAGDAGMSLWLIDEEGHAPT
jgi:hypothetical protein